MEEGSKEDRKDQRKKKQASEYTTIPIISRKYFKMCLLSHKNISSLLDMHKLDQIFFLKNWGGGVLNKLYWILFVRLGVGLFA